MKRAIEKDLVEWKDDPDRTPLIVRGARQVGKSFSISKFGQQCFEKLVVIDLEFNPKLHDCFESLDPMDIVAAIELRVNETITPGETHRTARTGT